MNAHPLAWFELQDSRRGFVKTPLRFKLDEDLLTLYGSSFEIGIFRQTLTTDWFESIFKNTRFTKCRFSEK